MQGQLRHLVEVSRLPSVTLRVLPFAAGEHLAMAGNFMILEFTGQAPGLVYTEGLYGLLYLERAAELRRHNEVFESLSRLALGEEDTRRFTLRMISEISN